METKHTKGPWQNKGSIIKREAENLASIFTLIGRVDESRNDGESWIDMRKRTEAERKDCKIEERANAKLIAAAPELLEALQYAMSDIEAGGFPQGVAIELMKSAIKKATS